MKNSGYCICRSNYPTFVYMLAIRHFVYIWDKAVNRRPAEGP